VLPLTLAPIPLTPNPNPYQVTRGFGGGVLVCMHRPVAQVPKWPLPHHRPMQLPTDVGLVLVSKPMQLAYGPPGSSHVWACAANWMVRTYTRTLTPTPTPTPTLTLTLTLSLTLNPNPNPNAVAAVRCRMCHTRCPHVLPAPTCARP
jgi:hypothetical protein